MKTYRTRYSIVLVLILVAAFVAVLAPLFIASKQGAFIIDIILLVIYVVIVVGALRTRYSIDEQGKQLIISTFYGLSTGTIDITKITRIVKTRCLLSAPAASLKRIRIEYREGRFGESAIISPYAQGEFLQELKKINPEIEIEV